MNTLDFHLQENLHFYTDSDKEEFMEKSKKMNDYIVTNGELLLDKIQKICQVIKKPKSLS